MVVFWQIYGRICVFDSPEQPIVGARAALRSVCCVAVQMLCVRGLGLNQHRVNSCRQDLQSFSPTGLLMNLKYYVSPYDLFEDGTGAPIILHENNGRSALAAGVGCCCLREWGK